MEDCKFTETLLEQEVIEAALAWKRDKNKLRNAGERVLAAVCDRYEREGG